MLSKFGEVNMKINIEGGRRLKNQLLEERLECFITFMEEEKVKQENVRCPAKKFFKTCASFHVVTVISDGSKGKFSCSDYF